MDNTPFPGAAGIPDNLKPNPPGDMPEPAAPGDAMKSLSPFAQAQDIDSIIAQLTLDRPLKLFIPHRERYTEYDFRIINGVPREMAEAHNKGWREVTDPELAGLFTDLVAGTDKEGKMYRPILCARSKAITAHVEEKNRMQLRSLYAGMDPANKDVEGQYTTSVNRQHGTLLDRSGAGWRIKLR